MNLALAGDILAAGQDAQCQLLRFQVHQQKGSKAEKSGSKEQGPRQRKGAPPAEKKSGAQVHPEGVELKVKNLEAVQTDFSNEPLQKVVCFNHDNTCLPLEELMVMFVSGRYLAWRKFWSSKPMKGRLEI